MRQIELYHGYEQILLGRTLNQYDKTIRTYRRGCFTKDMTTREKHEKAVSILRYAFKDVLGWDADVCRRKISMEVLVRHKLDNLLRYLDLPEEFNGKIDPNYFASLIYPEKVKFDRTKLTLDIYSGILNNDNILIKDNKVHYPKKFFQGEEGRIRACTCLKYALKKETFRNIEEVYELLADPNDKYIKKRKLALAMSNFETPVDFLQESLDPSQQDDFLYAYYKFSYLFNTVKTKVENEEDYDNEDE